MTRTWMWIGAAVWTAAVTSPALAVKPEEWKHEQPKDFLAGTLDNVVVSSQGEVMLGRQVKTLPKLNEDDQVVNALARAGDGKVYAATGPNGRVYQIDGDAVKEFARLPDGGTILSLLFDSGGRLLAATGGGDQARIYRIDGAGKAEVFHEPKGAKYVWAMARGSAGEIYAATGVEGQLFAIDADGRNARVLAKVKPKNLLSLAIGPENMLYAGTDEDGLVYRFNASDGKAYVLYDAKEAEISSIAIDDEGNIFAATASAESARPGRTIADKPGGTPDHSETRPAATRPSGAESTKGANGSEKKPATQPAAPRRPTTASVGKATTEGGNAIYRIDSNGFVTEVFREPVVILALTEHQGKLYAATGNEGRIYMVSPREERTTMLAKLEPAQATSLLRLPDGQLLIGTANSPSIVRMTEGYAPRGTLTSKAQDAGQVVKWGRIRWEATLPAGTKLTVATRSSNVEDIESDAWDEWSPEMDAANSQQIPSLSARFLQYRLTFESTAPDKTAVVRKLVVPYIEENRVPELSSLEVVAAREEAQKPTAAPQVKALVGMAGYGGATPSGPNDFWVIKWKAEDPNKDSLEYEVFYRPVGSKRWIQMKEKGQTQTEPLKIWDTRTVEDGTYEVRVVAKDTPSNPAGSDLSSARVSDSIIVDNTLPEIRIERADVKGRSVTVHAVISDTSTPITEASYVVDSNDDWVVLAADDDIFDSRNEAVTFTVTDLEPGEHRISIRSKDAWGNMRYVSRSVEIGG